MTMGFAIFLLSGCATPEKWQVNMKNPTPLNIAKNLCMQEAKQRYPEHYLSSTPNYSYPSPPSSSTITVDGKEVIIPNSNYYSYSRYDANESERKQYFDICMRGEGWENKNKVTGLLAFLFND
ncbi:hypothetical protein ACTXA3_00425 [Proteus mirabilis]|uniref:hypothetical protein n=1 Tax=Proteus mirabilis TaxID=584 RepID=UPI003FD74F15